MVDRLSITAVPEEGDVQPKQLVSVPNAVSGAGLLLSVLALVLGIVGGLLASVATNAQWKGEIEQRLRAVEERRAEDKRDLESKYDYIRTQNEVNGKSLSRIEASLDLSDRRKR